MKIKNLIAVKLIVALFGIGLMGCANVNEPKEMPQEEDYLRAFIRKIGIFDENHTWCSADFGHITIIPDGEIKNMRVYGYTWDTYYKVAEYENVTEMETVRFDMPYGTESVMIVADDVSYTAPVNSVINLAKAQGMAMASRTLPEADETGYNWILAVEDMGGSYDFDFNDVVVGLNITQLGSRTKLEFTALAAGGTLPVYIKFNIPSGNSLYGVSNSISPETSRLYPDDMDESKSEFHNWFGEGYSSSTMINTGSGPNVAVSKCKTSTITLTKNYYLSEYQTISGNSIVGITLEVEKPEGLVTLVNNPQKKYETIDFDLVNATKRGGCYCFNEADGLKFLDDKSAFEIEIYIAPEDLSKDPYLYIAHGTYSNNTWWTVEKVTLYGSNISLKSTNLLQDVSTSGTHTIIYKPNFDVSLLSHFRESIFLDDYNITINKISLSYYTDRTPEEEETFMSAPQMFLIPDGGPNIHYGQRWYWPLENVSIADAYPSDDLNIGFRDWCVRQNGEKMGSQCKYWHILNHTKAGSTFDRSVLY